MANWWQSIRDRGAQIKENSRSWGRDAILILVVVLSTITAFGLGRLSSYEEQRPSIRLLQHEQIDGVPMQLGGKYVASRKGSKYHFPWCTGARSMNENNKIWFDSVEDAKRAGYSPAGNCKGLQ